MHFSTAILALAATAVVSATYDEYEYEEEYPSSSMEHPEYPTSSMEHPEYPSSTVEHPVETSSAYEHPGDVTYTTEVVTAYTTYCPYPTEVVHGSTTYTVTEATTLTISDCPCTVSKPVYYSTVTECTTCSETHPVPTPPTSTEIHPIPTYTPPQNTTVSPVYPPQTPTASGPGMVYSPSGTSPPIATYTGAASSNVAGSWFVAAGFGLVALLM
jgi:hypothetical protein